MKKITAILTVVVMLAALVLQVGASYEDMDVPLIEQSPQNVSWPEGATATYNCVCSNDKGHEKYTYTWYIVYNGVRYTVGSEGKTTDPWRAFVDFSGGNTGTVGNMVMLDKIGKGLDGSEIYCVVKSSDTESESYHATIAVGPADMFAPPEITTPTHIFCTAGDTVELAVSAKSKSGNVSEVKDGLTYHWYTTDTGYLNNILLMFDKNGNEYNKNKISLEMTEPGVFYYVCGVFDGEDTPYANFSYSSVISVYVNDKIENVDMEVTKSPDKTVYTVGDKFDPKGMTVRVLRSDGFMDLKDGESLTFEPAQFVKAGEIKVKIIYEDISTELTVTVNKAVVPAPSITEQPKGGTFKADETCVLTVKAQPKSGENVAYQWYAVPDNDMSRAEMITGAVSSSYTVPKTEGVSYYFCRVFAVEGSDTSENVDSAVASVEYLPPETEPLTTAEDTESDVKETEPQTSDTDSGAADTSAQEPVSEESATGEPATTDDGSGAERKTDPVVILLSVVAGLLAAAAVAAAVILIIHFKKKKKA